jgi:hypothetical protein
MAGRPPSITAAIGAQIQDLRAKGVGPSGIVRALASRKIKIDRKTVTRWLAKNEPLAAPLLTKPEVPADAEPVDPAQATGRAGAALDGDDLASIAQCAAEVRAALRQWGPGIGLDPTSTRAYATLAKLNADLSARLVELRPREDVEVDRLETLGAPARTALLERARAAAAVDWKGRCAVLEGQLGWHRG